MPSPQGQERETAEEGWPPGNTNQVGTFSLDAREPLPWVTPSAQASAKAPRAGRCHPTPTRPPAWKTLSQMSMPHPHPLRCLLECQVLTETSLFN